MVDCDSSSPFEDLTFDGIPDCEHIWGTGKYRTICTLCNAKRLYDYQIEGARFLEKCNGNGALFDEQGLGKTIQFLAYLKYNKDAFPYLWVTKSGIKYQHGREIIRILGEDYVPQVITTGKQQLMRGVKGYLISWDLFRRIPDLNVFSHCQSIFLDECQAMSNPDSARTRAIRQVAKMIPRKIPASGTFWKNRGSEAYVALNMLAPARFPSFERFKKYDVEKYYHGNREKEGGLRPGFIDKIKDIAIRRERKQVMPELPLITRVRLNCELPEYARKALEKEEDKYLTLMDGLEIDGTEGSFAGNAALNQSIMIMRQIIGIAKVDTTVEHAQEFLEETDEKLIIFRHHIEVGDMLTTQLKEWCIENDEPEPVILTGGMSAEQRFDIQNKFNSPHYRLLIASQLSAGEGLNLQTCSNIIMHERQWNPANEEQCEGRVIRIGQDSDTVMATYVHATDTVDTDLDSIVEGKRIRFHNSMNKGEMIIWNENEIKKEIADKIRERRKKRKA
jgi:SNF2 family DNA or RNA helicase